MGYDFQIFWNGAQAVLQGQSPYTIHGFFSPLPFALAISPLGLIPFWPAYGLWTVLNLAALWSLVGKQLPKLLIFLPVTFGLWVGQVDLPILALGLSGTWAGVALSMLKPQLAIWILPIAFLTWWKNNHKDRIWKSILAGTILYLLPTIAQPGWWRDWLAASPAAVDYAAALTGLPTTLTFGFVGLLGIFAFVRLKPFSPGAYWDWVAAFNPISNIYSLCVLVQQTDWIAIGLSWLLLPLSLALHTGLPWAAVPIYLFWRYHRKPAGLKNRSPDNRGTVAV
jgi:hypothetical protein